MITRIKAYLQKNSSWYSLLSYPLFLIVIFVLIFVIGRFDRSIHLISLRQIVFLAAIFGLLISLIKNQKNLLLVILSFSSGVVVAYTNIGNLLQPFFTYLRIESSYLFDLFQSIFFQEAIPPDPTQAQDQWVILEESIQVLYQRHLDWLVTLPESVFDPISVNLTWGIIVWLITIWVYWYAVKKKRVVIGFLPPLIIIAGASSTIESG